MNHVSLFSGIGGIDLAAEWAGFRTVAFVERDKFCQRVLAKHWPGVPIWDDVCAFGAKALADAASGLRDRRSNKSGREPEGRNAAWRSGGVGLLTGGFPCQPHSVAGKRQASADERDLWGECARIAGELRPRWCVWENVPGLLTSESGQFFGRVLCDMESLGYVVGWCTYGAADVGALHRRDRVFIVCHLADAGGSWIHERGRLATIGEGCGQSGRVGSNVLPDGRGEEGTNVADAERERGRGGDAEGANAANVGESPGGAWRACQRGICWQSEPEVGRVANGISRRVDRLRSLGNAVVPQQIYPLLAEIAALEAA